MKPRKVCLHHKTAEKLLCLKKEAEREGVYRVAKRIHAVILNHEGKTSGDIAGILKSPRSCVSAWLRNYQQHGYEALLEGHRTGRPAQLLEPQQSILCDIIDSGPVAYGFLGGVWTSPMLARVIAQEFGICYHPGHVRRLLHQLGFSVQCPRRSLAKADPQKLDRWHRYTYPDIKKKSAPKKRP